MPFKQVVINTLAEQFNCILDLQKIGVVDFFMNGNNASLPVDLPVKHKSQGCNLHYSNCGGLDYWKIVNNIKPLQIFKDAKSLPLKEYDVIINDFDSITSLACKLQKVHSVRFGHQASFVSELTPRPEKKRILVGIIFKHYAPSPKYIGLHFEGYDSFILPLIIKNEIIQAVPKDLKHLTVYLPSFDKDCLEKAFSALAEHEFHWFLNDVNFKHRVGNVTYYPVNQNYFNESLIICHGFITGGGFETPAEALYLRK